MIIDGEKDNTVPWAIANASFERQQRNEGVTEIVKIPNRGHSLTIDGGRREVADTALKLVQRFVKALTYRERAPARCVLRITHHHRSLALPEEHRAE